VSDGNEHAGEEVKVVFRGLRDTVPFAIRLRAVLKYALRAARLKAVRLESVPAWKEDAAGRSPATSDPGRGKGQLPEVREP
jgi:hypothetical protein